MSDPSQGKIEDEMPQTSDVTPPPAAEGASKQGVGQRILGSASLVWLAAALVLVIYGGYLLSGDKTTNRNVFIAVAFAGAGGAAMGAAFSLAQFLAKSQYRASWTGYFFIRPFLGALVALLVYLVLRGTYISDAAGPESLNLYGTLGVAVLSGLYSKQILERLSALSLSLFWKAESKSSTAVPTDSLSFPESSQVDRYMGYLSWSIDKQSGTVWRLTIIATPHAALDSKNQILLDFGEGTQPTRVKMDLFVLSHNASAVDPIRATITAVRDASSGPAHFVLRGPEVMPGAIVEVSQRGRTVGALTIGSITDGS